MDILHADELRKKNQIISEEYRNELWGLLVEKIEDMTQPGKDLWQLNILGIAPGGEYNDDVAHVVEAAMRALKEKGYESWLKDNRMLHWSINKNEI